MAAPYIPITKSADKYTWPMIDPVIYGGGIEFRQVSDRVFMIIGLNEIQTRHAGALLKKLQKNAPVYTGRLRKSYDVYPIQYKPGEWALAITNRMTYFKFPYHYYRGEIKWNRKFKRDFVRDSVDYVIKKLGGEPPKQPTPGKPPPKPAPPAKPVQLPKESKKPVKTQIKEVAAKVERPKTPFMPKNKTEKAYLTRVKNRRLEYLNKGNQIEELIETLKKHSQTDLVKANIKKLRVLQQRLYKESQIFSDFVEYSDKLPAHLEKVVQSTDHIEIPSVSDLIEKPFVEETKKTLKEKAKKIPKTAAQKALEKKSKDVAKVYKEAENKVFDLKKSYYKEKDPAKMAQIKKQIEAAEKEVEKLYAELLKINKEIEAKVDTLKSITTEKPINIEGTPTFKNEKQAAKYFSDKDNSFVKWRKDLTDDQRNSLQNYQIDTYKGINYYLRTGKELPDTKLPKEFMKPHIDLIDQSVSKKLKEPLQVYRAFNDPAISKILESGDINKLKGMVYSDKAYMSTTLDRRVTDSFLRDLMVAGKIPIRATIKLPKNQRVAMVQDLANVGNKVEVGQLKESELLLPRNVRFRIKDVKLVEGYNRGKIKIRGIPPGKKIRYYEIEMEVIE